MGASDSVALQRSIFASIDFMILRSGRAKSHGHKRMSDLYSRLGGLEAPNRFALRNAMMVNSKVIDAR